MITDINNYRLTSLEEPPEEFLEQIMREAAQEAEKENEEATKRYFDNMWQEAQKMDELWNSTNPS